MKNKMIGIDLGSSDLQIYIPNKGILFNEPNIIAYNPSEKKVINVGYLALKMLGKEQEGIKVIRPIANGVVSSISKQTLLIKHILKEKKKKNLFKNVKVIVSCPSEISEVNVLAIKKVFKNLGAKSVELIPQSYLALLGCDNIDITSRGNMLITIGGGYSDITVASGNKVLISKTSTFSGKVIDLAIIRHLRKTHQLIIGEKTSEYIKMKIGSLEQFPENRLIEVSGRDIVTALPKSVIISTVEIKQAIMATPNTLLEAITDCLELTNPEVASDIIESGIIICGGSSLLGGMRDYLESHLNITVRLSSDPTYTVINGIKNYIHLLLTNKK